MQERFVFRQELPFCPDGDWLRCGLRRWFGREGGLQQVNGFLCDGTVMDGGGLRQPGVQGFGKGFDDECWHDGKRVAK